MLNINNQNKICSLCKKNPPIKNSHIVPAFVARAIRKSSPTGYLRVSSSPNKREQDSDTYPLICLACENLFSKKEKIFCENIFNDFRSSDKTNFLYGDWLHYFVTSVTWRTLMLDIQTLNIPDKVLKNFEFTLTIMQEYLLGQVNLADLINNHLVFATSCAQSNELSLSGTALRQAIYGYTLWKLNNCSHSGVIVNIGGILCVTHINLNENDLWRNTKVLPLGGKLISPQEVNSWLVGDFLSTMVEHKNTGSKNLSEKQRTVIMKK